MSNVEKITKLTEQHRKELELAEKHRNRAREHTEIAEKHAKKASDLENQIKYQKGEQVYDRVDALQLTPDELQHVLRLLDNKAQLMNVVQSLFSEKTTDNTGQAAESETPDKEPDVSAGETMETNISEDPDMPYDEIPVFGDDVGTDDNE